MKGSLWSNLDKNALLWHLKASIFVYMYMYYDVILMQIDARKYFSFTQTVLIAQTTFSIIPFDNTKEVTLVKLNIIRPHISLKTSAPQLAALLCKLYAYVVCYSEASSFISLKKYKILKII